jgi:hypothetical protein
MLMKEDLLGSFGKMSKEVDEGIGLNDDTNEYLEYSFFKSLPEVSLQLTQPNVMTFEVNNDPFTIQAKGENENTIGTDGSGSKKEKGTCGFIGNADGVLFSGYFGQKNTEDDFNGNIDGKVKSGTIHPFPVIEEEKRRQNSAVTFDPINRVSKKLKLDKSLNNSFISSSLSRNKNSFSDLAKNISLNTTSFSKKKSKINTLPIELLSTEEIELERIRKEREELKKLKMMNSHMAEKVKIT